MKILSYIHINLQINPNVKTQWRSAQALLSQKSTSKILRLMFKHLFVQRDGLQFKCA